VEFLHRLRPPGHRPQQRQDRHLAVPRVGGDAVRRAVRLVRLLRTGATTGHAAPRS
jgi:hypothetical protein